MNERTDTDRINFLANYPYKIEFVQPNSQHHETVKKKYPLGFFRVVFGRKSDNNRFNTFQAAVDTLMDNQDLIFNS